MAEIQTKLLEGKYLAAEIQEEIRRKIENALARGLARPHLCAIQAGEDPSTKWYIGQQKKLAAKLGIDFTSIESEQVRDHAALLGKLEEINRNSSIHGIFLSMPLPQGFDPDRALQALDPHKDVEGIHPESLGLIVLRRSRLIPSTAYAAIRLLESTGLALRGKLATIVGQSAIVGRPVQLILGEKRVTTIVCNTGTPVEEIEGHVSRSDIVIACAGKPGVVKGEWIKPGAVVIDVGTTEVHGKLVGDVEFETARERAGFITPVPGGVGPLTVTMLMQNLMHAYEWQHES